MDAFGHPMSFLRSFIFLLLISVPRLSGALIPLFDGASGLPASQGWSFLSLPAGASQTLGSTSTNLDTTASSSFSAGYNILPPISLDLNLGFHFFFDVRVNSETHSSNDRAGFSVILLSSNLQGIELAFWSNEIWAQNQNFTHGEGVVFATSALTHYELFLDAAGYRLHADDQLLLSGSLRNYSGQSASPLAAVYSIPNFLFLGDDTTSAAANIDFASAAIEEVPEPATLGLFFAAATLLAASELLKRRSRQASTSKL